MYHMLTPGHVSHVFGDLLSVLLDKYFGTGSLRCMGILVSVSQLL